MNKKQILMSLCFGLISNGMVIAKTPEIRITNATNEVVWANINNQTSQKNFAYQTTGVPQVKTVTVPDYKLLIPQNQIVFKPSKVIEAEGMAPRAYVTFLRIKQKQKYMIVPKAVPKVLSLYIDPLMNQYGIIWPSSDKGYSILSKGETAQNITIKPATTEVPGTWMEIEIPTFETFTKEVPYKTPIITYRGWNTLVLAPAPKPVRQVTPVETTPAQPVVKKPTPPVSQTKKPIIPMPKTPKVKLPKKPKFPFN